MARLIIFVLFISLFAACRDGDVILRSEYRLQPGLSAGSNFVVQDDSYVRSSDSTLRSMLNGFTFGLAFTDKFNERHYGHIAFENDTTGILTNFRSKEEFSFGYLLVDREVFVDLNISGDLLKFRLEDGGKSITHCVHVLTWTEGGRYVNSEFIEDFPICPNIDLKSQQAMEWMEQGRDTIGIFEITHRSI